MSIVQSYKILKYFEIYNFNCNLSVTKNRYEFVNRI